MLRSRCALKKLVMVNAGMSNRQREAVIGTVWRPLLQYREIAMERHLTLSLIKCWAFRIGVRRVPFSVFDVALFTGLPATGRRVELEGEELSIEVGILVRGCMADWEEEEMASRVPGRSRKKRRFFRNYVAAMAKLCEENNRDEQVGLWLRLYVFMVLSGVLFPRTPYGATGSMLHYVEDVDGMAGYAWAEAVWQVLVEMMGDTERKLTDGPLSEVHLNGFCLLIQVWFYEHTTRFDDQDKKQFPRISSWVKVDNGGRYDADELLRDIKEDEFMATDPYGYYVDDGEGWLSVDERLRCAREAYTLEKTAHEKIKIDMQKLEEQLMELKSRLITNRKKEAQDEEVGRAEEELQTAGQSGVKGSCIGVPGNDCGGKLVGDMVGGVDHSCSLLNEQTGVEPAEGEDIRAGMGIVTDVVAP
ncbi:hypothetical protein Cgig2_029578 [Carnegiea gigantea]|uniref:Aminotransferase-like plant mobile domain-containing protein n=1 Tax=Carnegiea gigantea TaxID=171969 RepID=A0A9Q1Q7Q6_9CARY|nr:hypothetical protein Cgig2_029578 [Carnegiea gigantea]